MKITELFKTITIPQAWAISIAVISIIGGIYTFGYKQGFQDHQIKICYELIKLRDKENLKLTNDKQDLKNKITKYKTIIFALQREKKEIQPILQYLIDEYEKDLKRDTQ